MMKNRGEKTIDDKKSLFIGNKVNKGKISKNFYFMAKANHLWS